MNKKSMENILTPQLLEYFLIIIAIAALLILILFNTNWFKEIFRGL